MSCFRVEAKPEPAQGQARGALAPPPPQWHSINLPPQMHPTRTSLRPLLRARLGKALSEDVAARHPCARSPSRLHTSNSPIITPIYLAHTHTTLSHVQSVNQYLRHLPVPSAAHEPACDLRPACLGCDSSSLSRCRAFVPAAKPPIPAVAPFSGSLCRCLHSIRCLLPQFCSPLPTDTSRS